MPKGNLNNRLVYSTKPDFVETGQVNREIESLPPSGQKLKVSLDKKQRRGKVVTLITGFVGQEGDLKALGNRLKKACGTGGSVKNGEILIQGDFTERVVQLLKEYGYSIRGAGG